jgi:nicotinamide mononucleotide (NMN) deamidase PncC
MGMVVRTESLRVVSHRMVNHQLVSRPTVNHLWVSRPTANHLWVSLHTVNHLWVSRHMVNPQSAIHTVVSQPTVIQRSRAKVESQTMASHRVVGRQPSQTMADTQ